MGNIIVFWEQNVRSKSYFSENMIAWPFLLNKEESSSFLLPSPPPPSARVCTFVGRANTDVITTFSCNEDCNFYNSTGSIALALRTQTLRY